VSRVLFLVGAPGVGKTTLVRGLLGSEPRLVLKPKWTLSGTDICAGGHYTGAAFDGADTIAYNGARAAFEYWVENLRGYPLTILDGDRFSNANALSWWVDAGADICCAHLTLPESRAQQRRDARGTTQNPTWVKGRATKAARFAERVRPWPSREFPATYAIKTLRSQVAAWVRSL
jgi:hypothetical protein